MLPTLHGAAASGLGAEVTRMESDSDDVPLAQRVPKAAPRPAPAAGEGGVKRKAPPSADVAPKRPKPAAASKPRADSGARAKKPAASADESSSDEDDEEGDEAKAGRSASRAAKKLEKDRKAVAEMSRIKKGVRLPCSIGLQTPLCCACCACWCAHAPFVHRPRRCGRRWSTAL